MTPLELVELVALASAELSAAPGISSTKDVNVIVSFTTYADYLGRLGAR
jgi:hypothetical protein